MSEINAALCLMADGWQVSEPIVDEVYDLKGFHPVTKEFARFQVKSLVTRTDRNGEMVIPGKKGNGEPYSPSEVDYMIGVTGTTAYMVKCSGLSEYWASKSTAAKRWVKLEVENSKEESA